MTYEEALIVQNKNKHLIGKKISHGGICSNVVIAPSDNSLREDFIENYIRNNCNQNIIQHYNCNDYVVLAIDLSSDKQRQFVFYENIK